MDYIYSLQYGGVSESAPFSIYLLSFRQNAYRFFPSSMRTESPQKFSIRSDHKFLQ